ncbi:MAG: UvrD-helicase domain-containing protein [Pseudomonadota bacterium]
MKILEYSSLDTTGLKPQYDKVRRFLESDDFKSAEVKKLGETDYYRVKLDYANRLLLKFMRYRDETYALALEVIANHAYNKSRFLRGARIDEDKVIDISAGDLKQAPLPELKYVNAAGTRFHFLDKAISFDDAQNAIYQWPLPLIIIGSAGSGKTALTLEKMKLLHGDVLYVTHSDFLAQNSRNVYYSNHFENEKQNVDFLSFRDYLESIHVPAGREVDFPQFRGWYNRQPLKSKLGDAHRVFEEFKGVLTGAVQDNVYLDRADYLALGVRQSIFLADERPLTYDLFEKYLAWLKESNLYDINIAAHNTLELCKPKYDYAVIDEVQDLTNIQLALIMRSLHATRQFMMCGDANQIVHPNFFSWSKIKSWFYGDDALRGDQLIRLLVNNYRNSSTVTDIANRLLRIKIARFGSIDQESNYLIESRAERTGVVELLSAKDNVIKELNDKTRKSARFAVLVLRDDHKAEAQRVFHTPLVFSVQEAKGLEYDNIVLFNIVSAEREKFQEITGVIDAQDLHGDLTYARAKDKSDKSMEAYKFYINAFYVAITRAVENLYIVERDTRHPILSLLNLNSAKEQIALQAQNSSLDEWQKEARKLELQGKQEQADAIRANLLHTVKVPWEVIDTPVFLTMKQKTLDAHQSFGKNHQILVEYANFYDDPYLHCKLTGKVDQYYNRPSEKNLNIGSITKYVQAYERKNFKDVLAESERYGIDFRNRFNHTPLMLAARTGNLPLISALLERGANKDAVDNYGRSAFHIAIWRAILDQAYAKNVFPAAYPLLAPAHTDVQAFGKLIRIDNRIGEFFLLHAMIALLKTSINHIEIRFNSGYSAAVLEPFLNAIPDAVLPPERKSRQYITSLLSRNEINRDYRYNRFLFKRIVYGHYFFNTDIKMRVGDQWLDFKDALNVKLMRAVLPAFGANALDFLEDSAREPHPEVVVV